MLAAQCSSAFAITEGTTPLLLVDVGFGVVRAYRQHFGENICPIFITHNHSDHAAELPVLGALLSSTSTPGTLYAETLVLDRIVEHRLHELVSTGSPIDDFFDCRPLSANVIASIDGNHAIELLEAQHSERCFGFILYRDGSPVFAASSDSAYSTDYYNKLARAPIVLLDGREHGNKEHSSFEEIEAWAGETQETTVWVSGYGTSSYAPSGFRLAVPGQSIPLVNVVSDDTQ